MVTTRGSTTLRSIVSTQPLHAIRSAEPVVPRRVAEWSSSPRGVRRPNKLVPRTLSLLAWLAAAAVATGIYTNVVADDSALRQRTNELAREHAGCGERCHVGEMQGRRTVLGYDVDYAIDGVGKVHVSCRRSALILGEHACEAQSVGAR